MVQNTYKFHPKYAKKASTLVGSVLKHGVGNLYSELQLPF